MEPYYLAQTAEPMDDQQRWAWYEDHARRAEAAGCTWRRYTIHPDRPELVLIEAWTARPDNEGEPRFQFAAA